MSQLISLSKDKSIWRYEKEMDCDWQAFPEPGKYPYQIHRYTVMDIDGHQFEIDAVYSKTGGPMRVTVSAVCHLEGARVGITRATGGVYGWGNSNFTYVEVDDTLLGVSSPELQYDDINDPIMIEPMVQVWSRTWVTRRLYTPKEPIAVEQTKIPGKDGTWQQRVQEGSAIKGRLLVSDGSLAAGLSGGNPRDIRLRKLGLLKIGESATDPALPPQGDTVSSYDDFRRYYEAKTGIKSEFIGLTREQKNVLARQRRQAWLDSKSPSERQELDSLSEASTADANDMDSHTSEGGGSVTDQEDSNGD